LLTSSFSNGAASGGWGAVWCSALSARFFDPTTFSNCLIHLIGNQTIGNSLLNRGAPATFQIDGNFGGVAAIAEALLQSHESISANNNGSEVLTSAGIGNTAKIPLIRLLPTIPDNFFSAGAGYVKGILAHGGFEVEINWDDSGKLTSASITSQNRG
jgi:alpha-L-fucosidase 2